MYQNEILEEIHKHREEYAKSFNFDLNAILRDLKSKQNTHPQKISKLQIKRKSSQKLS